MKAKRIIILAAIFIMVFTVTAFAKPAPNNMFLGEIIEVNMDSKQENTMLLVKGYLKSCDVFPQELVAVVSKDTKLATSCGKEVNEIKFEKGDNVFIELNPAMTFSIPPQSSAVKIQVSKSVKTN